MDNESHKKTWNNFTKFVLWGSVLVVVVLIYGSLFVIEYQNDYWVISENKKIEKRVSLVPDIVKKYTNLGLEQITKGYGDHIGFSDELFVVLKLLKVKKKFLKIQTY